MQWLNGRKAGTHGNVGLIQKAGLQAVFADQNDKLFWTALMITGNAESAKRSIVDATGIAKTESIGFRTWLVEWAHLSTARAALRVVRSAIRETAAQFVGWACSHGTHKPLSPAEVQALTELDPYGLIERLDILARVVLVLHGCQRMSLSDCVLLLNVPVESVLGAYCRALELLGEFAKPAQAMRRGDLSAALPYRLQSRWSVG